MECVKQTSTVEDISEYGDESEVKALFEMVNNMKLSDTVSACLDILCSKQGTYMDNILFKLFADSAKAICEKNGKENIHAYVFLKCIMDSPTDEIKTVIGTQAEGKKKLDLSAEAMSKAAKEVKKAYQKDKDDEKDTETDETSSEGPEIETVQEDNLPPKEQIVKMTEKVKLMQKELSSVVFGQDHAISVFTSGYFQSELRSITDKTSKKPKATYLFAGPPGVGKTFLAKRAAQLIGLPVSEFDMSEYSDRDALMELTGTNKSFKGDKEGALTGFVAKHPKCVLIFDEIEKANIAVIHLFLQVLDAGRLRDTNSGQEVDFSQTIIIFITNAGRKVYENSLTPNLSGISRKQF